jgi:hypothetical protein
MTTTNYAVQSMIGYILAEESFAVLCNTRAICFKALVGLQFKSNIKRLIMLLLQMLFSLIPSSHLV